MRNFGEMVEHSCKLWKFLKGPCPYRPLEWHEDEEDDDEEDEYYEARKPVEIRGVPQKRRSLLKRGQGLAEAEAVVRAIAEGSDIPVRDRAVAGGVQVLEALYAGEASKWVGRLKAGEKRSSGAAYLALALEGLLVGGAIALLGHGFKKSLPVGLNLDARLASLFKSRSTGHAKGPSMKGGAFRFTVPRPH